nr:hypothetical protein [Tanacetum cinerariifolium]
MGHEVISTIPARKTDEFIKSSVDDLFLILREYEVTSDREQLVDFLIENVDVAGLPRHLVKRSFNHLLKITYTTKELSEPLRNDSKPRSYDVTFSNPLFDFNDDDTLCYDNPLFDEEFEDISSLDPPELTPVIGEPILLVTIPLPCTDVLGDDIVDIDLLLGEQLDTLLTGDREIHFNLSRDIEELERILAMNMSQSQECHDLEGDILYFKQLLNEDTSSIVSPTSLPTESSSLDLPLPDPRQVCLREVERFDPFFSLTQSGNMMRVMKTPSLVFIICHHPVLLHNHLRRIPYDLEDLRGCFLSFIRAPDVIAEEISEKLNEDKCFEPGGEIFVSTKIEDDDYFPFMFVIRIFLPYLIFPEISPLFLSAESEDTIFDPGIFD